MDTIMHQQQYADFASEYGVGGMGSEMARNTQQERKLVKNKKHKESTLNSTLETWILEPLKWFLTNYLEVWVILSLSS